MKNLFFTMLTMLLPIIAAAELSEDSPLTSVDYNEASYSTQVDLKNTGEAPVEISINVTNFPDENFRNYLLTKDYGKDGVLTETEIESITSIPVNQKGISSLKGIEYFTALKSLYCYNNQLIALDVSKNMALTYLDCDNNQLTALDVSKNTALTNLNCIRNQLTALDVSKNTALTNLNCTFNQLTALYVSKNTALKSLSCSNNQLSALDVSKNTALTSLYCYNNQLTALDVSKNTALTKLDCDYNQLTALDVSKNTALKSLYCYNNQLTALNVNTSLTTLHCYNNQLTALDVSQDTALTELVCFGNDIKGEAMTALINSLPNNNSSESHYFRAIYFPTDETNVLTKSQVAAVKAKGWIPQYYDYVWKEYEGSDDEKCEKPTILYANGELTFGCATEGVEYHWTITNGTDSSGTGSKVTFSPKVTVSVYASKEGYKDSDTTTLVISVSGMKGDVNNNGGIDIGDAVTIVNFLVGKTTSLSRTIENVWDEREPQ